ncbi:MAG: acetylornithine transaminase [Aeromicrobium sp.]|uniref:acetylornithine transaminase n=1 Tax=Aeromicrobium sp. TaxID=1871063 RepID=UPI003C356E0D
MTHVPQTSSAAWTDRYAHAVMNTFGPPQTMLVRGEGCYVWDADGNRYLDLLAGIAVNALGHAHPALVEAVSTQMSTLGHVSNFFATEPQVTLAEKLLSLVGQEGRVFFANSGAEANEAALKATRRTGRTKVVALHGSFHGRTMGALALTSKEPYRAPFEPLPGDVVWAPYGDADALDQLVDDTVAAVVIEPIQGEAGVIVPPENYLARVREITQRHGALMWVDEVQSGMGRTGEWFAHAPSGVVPDLITLAKGLGGGLPIGACIALGDAATLLQPGHHGTTFGGNPVSTAAALAVVDTIETDDLLTHVVTVGERFRAGLSDHPAIAEITGRGLFLGLVLASPVAAQTAKAALGRGLIVNAPTPDRLRLVPPLVLSIEQADDAIAILRGLLDTATDA